MDLPRRVCERIRHKSQVAMEGGLALSSASSDGIAEEVDSMEQDGPHLPITEAAAMLVAAKATSKALRQLDEAAAKKGEGRKAG